MTCSAIFNTSCDDLSKAPKVFANKDAFGSVDIPDTPHGCCDGGHLDREPVGTHQASTEAASERATG
jgi:hypothetical protein